MNGFVSYLWKSGILQNSVLQSADGKALRIIDPGKSTDTAPFLFKEAKVGIDDKIWCGDVVLCRNGKETYSTTETDATIENTILYVTINESTKGAYYGNTTRLNIACPEELIREFEAAEQHRSTFTCTETITRLPNIQLHSYLSRLLTERVEEKRKIIERIFAECDRRWDDALLKVVIRSFGFGIQSTIFEKWANILNTQALGKHRDNLTQIEAIMFGQAGLLDEESIPYYYREFAIKSDYYNELKREYRFLSNKFGLESIDYKIWGNNATPHLRIARVASLYYLNRLTMSGITAANTLTEIYRLFSHPLNGYWQNHTCFGGTETGGNGCMRQKQVDVIIINSIVPVLYIYGKYRKEERFCGMAEDLLHQIEPEENSIIRRWREQGIRIDCAADSQALLHLSRSYCRATNCISCPFVYHYIKERLAGKP